MISNKNSKYVLKILLIFFLFFGVVILIFTYTQQSDSKDIAPSNKQMKSLTR